MFAVMDWEGTAARTGDAARGVPLSNTTERALPVPDTPEACNAADTLPCPVPGASGRSGRKPASSKTGLCPGSQTVVVLDCRDPACRARVCRWARYWVGDPDDAQDVCQEVCLRCVERRATVRDEAPRPNWLYRVTFNLAHDFLRKRVRELRGKVELGEEAVQQALQEQEEARAPDPESAATVESVRAALAQLTSRQSELLQCKYMEGRSHREIARRLGIEEQSAKKAVSRARAAFEQVYLFPDEEV